MSKLAQTITLSALLSTSLLASAQSHTDLLALNEPVTSASFTNETKAAPALNTAAIEDFRKTYGDAANETWSSITSGSRASFKKNEVTVHVDYDNAGNWVSTLSVYQEKNLPADVRKVIVAKYAGYDILTTNEVATPEAKIYLVQIQNQTSLKVISVNNGRAQMMKSYHRADR